MSKKRKDSVIEKAPVKELDIKQEVVIIDGEDKLKTTYSDGTVEYQIL